MSSQQIETGRLLLRRWRPTDHTPFAAICADAQVMQYICDGKPQTAHRASQTIKNTEASWETNGFGLFAVALKETDTLIGFCGLAVPNFLPQILPSVEIGWRLSQATWGKGYGTEAARGALAFALDQCGLTDIVSICQPRNLASINIMKKLGMQYDRDTKDPVLGTDVLVYRLPQTAIKPSNRSG